MRIVISEYFPPDETEEQVVPEKLIADRILQRASLMLASYVNINIPREKVSKESDFLFNRLISESLNNAKTISSSCVENNFCVRINEYDISSINREIEQINR